MLSWSTLPVSVGEVVPDPVVVIAGMTGCTVVVVVVIVFHEIMVSSFVLIDSNCAVCPDLILSSSLIQLLIAFVAGLLRFRKLYNASDWKFVI